MKRQGSLSVEERSSGDGISSFTLLHMYTCYIVYAIDKKEAMRSGMTQIRYLGIIFCSTLQSVRYERRLCEIRERVPNPGRMCLVSPSDISRIDVPAAKKARTQKQRRCSDTWCDDLKRWVLKDSSCLLPRRAKIHTRILSVCNIERSVPTRRLRKAALRQD